MGSLWIVHPTQQTGWTGNKKKELNINNLNIELVVIAWIFINFIYIKTINYIKGEIKRNIRYKLMIHWTVLLLNTLHF